MKRFILAIFMVSLMVSTGYGAESCVQTLKSKNGINVLSIAWVTDASGNFVARETAYPIDGWVVMVETDPSGTAAPTDDYDPALTSTATGVDVMGGALADRDTANTELVMPLVNSEVVRMPVLGTLTFDVTNAGASKGGTLNIYFVR